MHNYVFKNLMTVHFEEILKIIVWNVLQQNIFILGRKKKLNPIKKRLNLSAECKSIFKLIEYCWASAITCKLLI